MIVDEKFYIEVTVETLDQRKLYDFCVTEDTGAVNIFVGTVRDHFDHKKVTSIDYQGYSEMAEKQLQKIVLNAFEKWAIKRIAVQHRLGLLKVRQSSVVIAVSASHRVETFEACRYIIEEIKKDLPIWKKEYFIDGDAGWKPDKI